MSYFLHRLESVMPNLQKSETGGPDLNPLFNNVPSRPSSALVVGHLLTLH